MLRKTVLTAAIHALVLFGPTIGASATTITGGGVPLSAGATFGTLTGTDGVVGTAVITTNLGNITCATGGVSADVTTNDVTTAKAHVKSLVFTTCTDSIPLISVSSCGTSSGIVSVTGLTINIITSLLCSTNIGTCGYATPAGGVNGWYANATHELTYSGVTINGGGGSLGTGTWGSTGALDVVFGPFVANNNSAVLITIS